MKTNFAGSTFFEKIDTEEKAYWIGFLYGDGSVDAKRPVISLLLQHQDYQHLLKFGHIFNLKPKPPDKLLRYRIRIFSRIICNDLLNHGIIPNKTYIDSSATVLKAIPDDLFWHFLRGYFDADGSITGSNEKDKFHSHFTIISYNKNILDKLKQIIETKTGCIINVRLNNKLIDKNHNYKLDIAGCKQLSYFSNFLYSNATIYLERKKEKFDKLIEYCNIEYKKKTSIYNGVSLDKNKKWRVSFYFNRKTHYIGTFSDEKIAAQEYNKAAILCNLPKYKLNFQ